MILLPLKISMEDQRYEKIISSSFFGVNEPAKGKDNIDDFREKTLQREKKCGLIEDLWTYSLRNRERGDAIPLSPPASHALMASIV